MSIKEIGRVTVVRLARERGILTLTIELDFGGAGQSFGGFALDAWDPVKGRRVGHASGTDFISRVFDVFGVDVLGDIVGRVVYALRDEPGGVIVGLESPAFDGARRFLVADWKAEWKIGAPKAQGATV